MRHGLSRFWLRSRGIAFSGIAFSGIAFSGTGSAFGFDIQFDYSKDTGNFFNRQRRILLYRAAQAFEDLFQDDLTSISPSGSNTWVAEYRHPSTGAQTSTSNLVIPAETVVIFVGARDLGDGITSESSMGSFTASGSVEWIDVLKRRGQCGITEGPNANEVAPWGGWPTLNNDLGGNLAWWEDWSDRVRIDTDVDMFWVVVRELAHVLGFGVSDSWFALVEEAVGGQKVFTGTQAMNQYLGGGPVPLAESGGFWVDGIESLTDGTYIPIPTWASADCTREPAMVESSRSGPVRPFCQLPRSARPERRGTDSEPEGEDCPQCIRHLSQRGGIIEPLADGSLRCHLIGTADYPKRVRKVIDRVLSAFTKPPLVSGEARPIPGEPPTSKTTNSAPALLANPLPEEPDAVVRLVRACGGGEG